MDAIAFIWKTLLTKVSIKTLILSMSFDCFLSGSSRLYRKPAWCVLFSTSGPSGWKELLSMALCPVYGLPLSVGRGSQTNSSSTNLSWMEWLYCLQFQFWPRLQRLFFPSLTRFFKVSHLRPVPIKTALKRTSHLKLLESGENIL